MSEEEYKPTVEDNNKAEEMMSLPENYMLPGLSKARQEELKRLQVESGLDEQLFEEIAETFDCYKFNDRSFEIRFKIRGHRVAIGVFALEQAGNGTLSLDRVLVGEEDKRRQFFDKYKLVIEGLARLNNLQLEKKARENTVEVAMEDLLK